MIAAMTYANGNDIYHTRTLWVACGNHDASFPEEDSIVLWYRDEFEQFLEVTVLWIRSCKDYPSLMIPEWGRSGLPRVRMATGRTGRGAG